MDDLSDCGCCDGGAELPEGRGNAPGAPAIRYRAGTHASFKAALLARLSSEEHRALAALRTRRDDDFAIATCDAAATLLDVLTFYQERHANELYLRTATERRSIVELARLIGYRLAPGVAAGTWLAFALEDAPGLPAMAAEPVTIPVGTRVQSVPGPDESPQTFETVEAVPARVEWNAMPVQLTERQDFPDGMRELYVASIATQVQPGDVILIVGDERLEDAGSERWDARVVDAVEVDNDNGRTRLRWSDGLGHANPLTHPAMRNPRAYVFRQRAALFGHNAPDPRLMFKDDTPPAWLTDGSGSTLSWANFAIQSQRLDLDSSYPKVLAGSWLLLAGGSGGSGSASLPGYVELYGAKSVRQLSRSDFGLSGRVTRVALDTDEHLDRFSLRSSVVFAQSDELPLARRPLAYPLYGAELALERRAEGLAPGRRLALAGKRQRLRIVADDDALEFRPDGEAPVAVKPGDSFRVLVPPAWLLGSAQIAIPPGFLAYLLRWKKDRLRWRLLDRDGRAGTLEARPAAIALQGALKDDPVVRELCSVAAADDAVVHDRDRTSFALAAPLANVYDRATTSVCANLAPATHGESVGEIAGSGDAAAANQRFLLKQAPLTYVSAATPSGREATLAVRVDGLLWTEVPSLFEQPAEARVYALRQDDDGRTIVQFGDGVEGARLPSGRDNLRFAYRKFLGRGGNLAAGRLTTLLGRPQGVKTVTNPVAAAGGEDAEDRDAARRNAPQTMLTLGRAVSLQDYADFARAFAGIAKADAIWIGSGAARGIHVTVAGPDGAALGAGSATLRNLVSALRRYGDPLLALSVATYAAATFRIKARIKVVAAALAEDVFAAVEAALRAHYAFDARDFGQTVSIDEVMSVIHRVDGVDGIDVDALYRVAPGAPPTLQARLFGQPARLQPDGRVAPAELLTLDPTPLKLEAMA